MKKHTIIIKDLSEKELIEIYTTAQINFFCNLLKTDKIDYTIASKILSACLKGKTQAEFEKLHKLSGKRLTEANSNIMSTFKYHSLSENEIKIVRVWEKMTGKPFKFVNTITDKKGFIKTMKGMLDEFDATKNNEISEIERLMHVVESKK